MPNFSVTALTYNAVIEKDALDENKFYSFNDNVKILSVMLKAGGQPLI